MAFKLRYKSLSLHAVLVEWPAEISEVILEDVLILKTKIENSLIKEVVQVNSTYNSLVVLYVNSFTSFGERISTIDKIYSTKNNAISVGTQLWKIPVCYDESFGLDLEIISIEKKRSKEDIIKQHYAAIYTVYFIGFLPGFLYLGGLDKSLHVLRKSIPRLQVEKGAVAIGGNQTGIYPKTSPGGWQILGRSPVNLFDKNSLPPSPFSAGDKIKFFEISKDDFYEIEGQVKDGLYKLKTEKHES